MKGKWSYSGGLIKTRMLRCKERREVPWDGGGSSEESSKLAKGDMIGRENSNLLHEGFSKLGAPLTVVLVCFAQGVGPHI